MKAREMKYGIKFFYLYEIHSDEEWNSAQAQKKLEKTLDRDPEIY